MAVSLRKPLCGCLGRSRKTVESIAMPRSIKYTRYPLQSCLDYESVLNLSGHRYMFH